MTNNGLALTRYRPHTQLDEELARLGYQVVEGWPDQRPITPSLVRSRLAPPPDAPPTDICQVRDANGQLLGAAALRWGSTTSQPCRLWGPIIAPHARKSGIGTRLLSALLEHASTSRPGSRIITAEIPAQRVESWAWFDATGWKPAPASVLLKRDLPLDSTPALNSDYDIRPLADDEDISAELAALCTKPGSDPMYAAHTYARWSADERFAPQHLHLAHRDRRLVGACLIFPLAHTDPNEPTEALLADLVISPRIGLAHSLRVSLAYAALNAAAEAGARVARAILPADQHSARHALMGHGMGFKRVDEIRYYAVVV